MRGDFVDVWQRPQARCPSAGSKHAGHSAVTPLAAVGRPASMVTSCAESERRIPVSVRLPRPSVSLSAPPSQPRFALRMPSSRIWFAYDSGRPRAFVWISRRRWVVSTRVVRLTSRDTQPAIKCSHQRLTTPAATYSTRSSGARAAFSTGAALARSSARLRFERFIPQPSSLGKTRSRSTGRSAGSSRASSRRV